MKTGGRKFIGFLVTVILYTVVLMLLIWKMPNMIVDLSAFAVQSSIGFCGIAALFFTSNVLEHFSNKNKPMNKNE